MVSHLIVFVLGVLGGGYGGYKYGAYAEKKAAAILAAVKKA